MDLNHTLTGRLRLTLQFFVSLFMLNTAHAEMLLDPTRPPDALLSSTDGEVYPTTPVLQSVVLSPAYKAAVINGEKVMLGSKYEGATLIKLNDHEAVLRNPDKSLQKLKMNDAVNKKVTSPISPIANKNNKHLTHSK